jgi:cardiolipin synthase
MQSFVSEICPFLEGHWRLLMTTATVLLDISASCHAILYKRDTRAAIAWVGFIWFVPLVGTLLYYFLGINRLQRKAKSLRRGQSGRKVLPEAGHDCSTILADRLGAEQRHFRTLARLVGGVTKHSLLEGNRLDPLVNGDEAYPSMLQAIDAAVASVSLSTYIFDNDRAGQQFVEALGRAVTRGVEVCVIIDDVGARYTWPTILGALRRAGVRVARFLPKLVPWSWPYANLRTHRKLLVVDGRIGFTGGMNIREGHVLGSDPGHPVQDLHFRVEGPVIAHLQEVFADDWMFCTGESLHGERWFPGLEPSGATFARGIPDGPDDDFEKIRMTILGAIACAQSSIRILTPYFLPDAGLITSLNIAAMRGVEVDILLPRQNNLRLVQWASTALLWQVLERGCRVWLTPPPFDHSKLMLVDATWAMIGSANWDPRSLRLNFEFNLECYDQELTNRLEALLEAKRSRSQSITLKEVDGRSLPVKLRDGVARLFSPYL